MSKISKVVYGNQTLIDLTGDTVTSNVLLAGNSAHGADGELIEGACTFNADTSDATANANAILSGYTAYGAAGTKLTGNMTNVGKQTSTISSKTQSVPITAGYHDGSGDVTIDSTEQSKIIADNIRKGVSILGVLGTMSGSEDVKASSFELTPYTTSANYLPNDFGDYNYFSGVTVNAIAYSTTINLGGGWTATIGTVKPT